MINERRQLADVYQQTINIVQKGSYTSENGEEVELLDNEPMLKGSRFYTRALDATSIPTIEGETKVTRCHIKERVQEQQEKGKLPSCTLLFVKRN